MTDIIAKTIADSIGEHSPRLFTVETRAPTMIHQEVLRHRRLITEEGLSVLGLGWEPDFSYSVSSTRAVPFAKLLQEVRDPLLRAAPVHWGRAQRGMVPGDEIDDEVADVSWYDVLAHMALHQDDSILVGARFSESNDLLTRREVARRLWALSSRMAAAAAETMVHFADPHKSIPNRMIAPYAHYNVLMTGTEPGWLNFFGLRLDGAADPIVRALAEVIWREWSESKPQTLRPGEWHLPYADDEDTFEEIDEWRIRIGADPDMDGSDRLKTRQRMSVARCAHLSYTSFETGERMTVEQCLNLYQRLVGSVPIHASPAEHQCTPDLYDPALGRWEHPEQSGNVGLGWIQYRKLLLREAVALLPVKYR